MQETQEIKEMNEQELNNELSNIEKEIKVIKESLKPFESRKKEIKTKLEQIQFQKELDSGASKELLEFYNLKIPNGNGRDYMSWCISATALELFEKYVNTDYWNRYESYCFTDELDQALIDYDFYEDEDDVPENFIREDVIDSFINSELKSLNDVTPGELEIIQDYIKICKGITQNNFKYDW